MIISNYKNLNTSPLREKLLTYIEEGIKSVQPEAFMNENISFQEGDLKVFDDKFNITNKRVFVIGAGKASAAMALSLENIIGVENITAGIVLSNDTKTKTKKIELYEADHPVPTDRCVLGAEKVLEMKEKYEITSSDVVIALISGGGSSLMTCPIPGISLHDKKETIEALIKSGANVHDITVIKKRISQVKGGKLARHFYPAQIISLVLSDVVGNDLDVIASGPFAQDTTTFKDACAIIDRLDLKRKLPKNVSKYILCGKDEENNPEVFKNIYQYILADNKRAVDTVKTKAEADGFSISAAYNIQGESKDVAKEFCNELLSHKDKFALMYGGETTVTIEGEHGKGGRNQEFVVACLAYLKDKDIKNFAITSFGTDGKDFIKESAGGIIDDSSMQTALDKSLSIEGYLNTHNAYPLLQEINGNIYIEHPTTTNVADVIIGLLENE